MSRVGSSLTQVRLAMMDRYRQILDKTVPIDPLPHRISDKTILIFPRLGPLDLLGRGSGRSMSFSSMKTFDIEYHRRTSYERVGDVVADIVETYDLLEEISLGEMSSGGTFFSGTVESVEAFTLSHFGGLQWNEWTFGFRAEITVVFTSSVQA